MSGRYSSAATWLCSTVSQVADESSGHLRVAAVVVVGGNWSALLSQRPRASRTVVSACCMLAVVVGEGCAAHAIR